jgi:hypothetical protein
VHRASIEIKAHTAKGRHVPSMLSASMAKEMTEARIALSKIISSLRYLATCGLAVRGRVDESSNLHTLLHLRADDVNELKQWLQRSGYKWISHDISNELLSIMSHMVLRQVSAVVQDVKFFSLIVDETSDASVNEQISICVRYVDSRLL